MRVRLRSPYAGPAHGPEFWTITGPCGKSPSLLYVETGGSVVITIEQEIEAESDAGTIFDAITDLRGYSRWLSPSKSYAGTTEISSDPIAVGTTYVEPGPSGVRRGTITELEPPTRVAFHQPMTMRPGFLGIIDITVRYTLYPNGSSVRVQRLVTLTLPSPLKLVRPLVLQQFRTESNRTLLALKAFVESQR